MNIKVEFDIDADIDHMLGATMDDGTLITEDMFYGKLKEFMEDIRNSIKYEAEYAGECEVRDFKYAFGDVKQSNGDS